MAQINLLKQNSSNRQIGEIIPSILAKLLILGLVGVVGYYAWIFTKVNKVNRDITGLQQEISKAQGEVANTKERNELLTRQAQLKELDGLMGSHIYFSQVLPELAKITLRTATYTNIKATTDGEITLSVVVPSLTDLDKFLQIFDSPELNEHFNDVRIGSFHKAEGQSEVGVGFDVRMKYNTALLKYKNQTTKK